jgi:hypothetical protein
MVASSADGHRDEFYSGQNSLLLATVNVLQIVVIINYCCVFYKEHLITYVKILTILN